MWLAEAGVYYYKARVYHPVLGRFMQTDPIGYGDGLNMYAYAGNDPVNGSDPSGMYTTPCFTCWTFGIPKEPWGEDDNHTVDYAHENFMHEVQKEQQTQSDLGSIAKVAAANSSSLAAMVAHNSGDVSFGLGKSSNLTSSGLGNIAEAWKVAGGNYSLSSDTGFQAQLVSNRPANDNRRMVYSGPGENTCSIAAEAASDAGASSTSSSFFYGRCIRAVNLARSAPPFAGYQGIQLRVPQTGGWVLIQVYTGWAYYLPPGSRPDVVIPGARIPAPL